MTTWRDVSWEYDCANRRVIAIVDDMIVTICKVPWCPDTNFLGRAIAHAWNVDLAAAQSWRELYGIDDSVVKV